MKKIFIVLLCMSMFCSLNTMKISASEKKPLMLEKVDNSSPKLETEKITLDDQLLEIFNRVKDEIPTLSSDGKKIILPDTKNEQYIISLYGTSNSAVISQEGQITQPLEDMTVYLYYQVENKETKESLHMDDPIIVKVSGQYNDSQINRPKVLPGIREWKGNQGLFNFSGNLVIKDDSLTNVASKIAFYIQEMANIEVTIISKQRETGDIVLEIDPALSVGNEGYTLDIDNNVTVKAPHVKGLLYAGATLSQMFMSSQDMSLPKGLMRDYPQYQVRSTMLDVARFYMPLDYLEEITKYAAFYKLNEIHVHINDDGGEQSTAFRVESKKYPAINSTIPADEVYSQEDYKNYQKEVYEYGVEVVTEIDTPAHCHSINYVDPSIMLDGSHIDLSNPEAIAFMKSLYDEFLDGDDPVFRNKKFNIGTDEYPAGHNEEMRAYMDEMIKYINTKDVQPRLWSGLNVEGSSYGGKTPVSNEAVFHFWSKSFANLKIMLEGEYPMINNIDRYLYIVPVAGYQNYLNIKNLYDTWEAGTISDNEIIKPGHPLLLGTEAALWNDIKVGASQFDIFDRHRDQIMLMAEKNWYGEKNVGQTGEEFMERVEQFGQYAPGVNPARYIKSNQKLIANYDFNQLEKGIVKDLSSNHYDANVVDLKVDSNKKALLLDGKGYVSLPFDSIGYPYTVDFEMMIAPATPANAIMFSGKDGVMYYNYDNTGKIGYQRKGYTYLFDYDVVENTMLHFTLTCSNTDLQLYIDNVLIGSGEYYKVSASKQASSTFVLPVEKIGSGIKGYLKSLRIYNKVTTSTVVQATNLALNKPVSVSGVEGGYKDDGTLVYPQFDPQHATDGNYNTRISLNRDDSAWVQIDLGELCLLDNVMINFNEKPGAYKLWISKDGEDWQCIDVQENLQGGTSGKIVSYVHIAPQARYVKYEQTKMFCATWAENSYYSGNFTELEVYGITETEINNVIVSVTQALTEVPETMENQVLRELLEVNAEELKMLLQDGSYSDVKSLMAILKQQVEALYSGNADVEKTDKAKLKELIKETIDETLYDSQSLKKISSSKTNRTINL